MDVKTRKALLAEYRERPPARGVFLVNNLVDHTSFLAAATDMPALWNRIRFQLRYGNHPNAALQAGWNRHGEAAFTFEVVAELRYATEGPHDVRGDLAALLALCREENKFTGIDFL